MLLFKPWRILLIGLTLLMLSCGKRANTGGGIVDNGNRDEPPKGQDPGTGPVPSLERVVRRALFAAQHEVFVPESFKQTTASPTEEIFLDEETEVLRLRLVTSTCDQTASFITTTGKTVDICEDTGATHHWVVVIGNQTFIEVRSNLREPELKTIVDTIQ